MKDITKIINRMNSDIKKAELNIEPVHTIEEGVQKLAEYISIFCGTEA